MSVAFSPGICRAETLHVIDDQPTRIEPTRDPHDPPHDTAPEAVGRKIVKCQIARHHHPSTSIPQRDLPWALVQRGRRLGRGFEASSGRGPRRQVGRGIAVLRRRRRRAGADVRLSRSGRGPIRELVVVGLHVEVPHQLWKLVPGASAAGLIRAMIAAAASPLGAWAGITSSGRPVRCRIGRRTRHTSREIPGAHATVGALATHQCVSTARAMKIEEYAQEAMPITRGERESLRVSPPRNRSAATGSRCRRSSPAIWGALGHRAVGRSWENAARGMRGTFSRTRSEHDDVS